MSKKSDAKKILTKRKKKKKLRGRDFVSTGSTLLNLACTGNPRLGFAKGHFYFIVGDSISGKTFLSLTCLAEASINPNFDGYRFIYDNAEKGAMMDIKKFFGKYVYRRLEPPAFAFAQSGPEAPIYSDTVESFYFHLDDAVKDGRPFIYILDSMDSLSSRAEQDKFRDTKKAVRSGKPTAGIMTDGKAKVNSMMLRQFMTPLERNKSILIIINQTRESLGGGFEPKTRSGGKALKFYATVEIWSSVRQAIHRVVRGKKREIGKLIKLKLKKNRIQGQEPDLYIPIYPTHGFDDVGSCVDYLVEEGHWEVKGKKSGKIDAKEFDVVLGREALIQYIEEEAFEKDLQMVVGEVWQEIKKASAPKRKRRYE